MNALLDVNRSLLELLSLIDNIVDSMLKTTLDEETKEKLILIKEKTNNIKNEIIEERR